MTASMVTMAEAHFLGRGGDGGGGRGCSFTTILPGEILLRNDVCTWAKFATASHRAKHPR